MIDLYEREEALFAESDSVRILLSESSPSVIGLPSPPQVQKPSVHSPPQVQKPSVHSPPPIPPAIMPSPPKQHRHPEPSSWFGSYGIKVNHQH